MIAMWASVATGLIASYSALTLAFGRVICRLEGPWKARVSDASKATDPGAWSAARNYYGANNGRHAVPTRPIGLEGAQISDRTRAASTWRFMPL